MFSVCPYYVLANKIILIFDSKFNYSINEVRVKHMSSRAGLFWPQGHYLNKLVTGLLDDATYQISML